MHQKQPPAKTATERVWASAAANATSISSDARTADVFMSWLFMSVTPPA